MVHESPKFDKSNSENENDQLVSVCGMESREQLAQEDAWEIGKLTPGQKRNARSRSLERRRPESRMIMDQAKMRLPIGNARGLPSIHDYPLRPLEDERTKAIATEVPRITAETIERQGVTNETSDNEKQMAERTMQNEQKTIHLNQQLQDIAKTANHLADALQKPWGKYQVSKHIIERICLNMKNACRGVEVYLWNNDNSTY